MDMRSTTSVDSKSHAGVRLLIGRMSFGRRLELMKRVRDLAAKSEFHAAGRDEKSFMDAGVIGGEIDRLYVEWGLVGVEGLRIDGEEATPQDVIEKGPEALFLEALAAIRHECGLSETERKN
jgi:hypothetical protein